jgi:hypothetical protein
MTGKPFQSKLTPHFALITEMRRKRQSWQEIVNHLKTLGITSDKGALIALTAVIGSVQGVSRYPWNSRAGYKSN